jgi:hypothetical protein
MKKILSVLLALAMLLVPVLSMAEAAEELAADYSIYTHTDEQYAFAYPNNWILLTAENIETVLDAVSETEDEQLAQMIATYGPQVQQTGMIMLLNETGMTNVNVLAQYVGMRATDDTLLTLAPQLVSQLSNVMEGIEFINEGTIVELGENTGLMIEYQYTLADTNMYGVQAYIPGETDLYIVTYTCAAPAELEATSIDLGFMLNSLKVK